MEAFAGIYDPKCGPPKVDALESLFVQLPAENDFKRVFTLYALANCSLRLMWFVVDVEVSAYSAGHVFSWIGRARRQTSLSKETNKCHTHRN